MEEKEYLEWWTDKDNELYYDEPRGERSLFTKLGFPLMPTHPLEDVIRGYAKEPGDCFDLSEIEFIRDTLHGVFPLLHKDGGIKKKGYSKFTDLEAMRTYINFPVIRIIMANNARCIYNISPYKNRYFDEDMIAWLRKAMQTYAKVAEDPIYQEVLDKYHWNEGQECDVQKFTYYLQRFINAQDFGGRDEGMSDYKTALQEIKNGRKETHWIWYIFPQMKGLGHSPTSDFYGIEDRAEAYAYMEHPILSSRLIEATEAVLNNKHSAYEIFGHDVIKFRACMLLFSTVSDNPVFKQVLRKHSW